MITYAPWEGQEEAIRGVEERSIFPNYTKPQIWQMWGKYQKSAPRQTALGLRALYDQLEFEIHKNSTFHNSTPSPHET